MAEGRYPEDYGKYYSQQWDGNSFQGRRYRLGRNRNQPRMEYYHEPSRYNYRHARTNQSYRSRGMRGSKDYRQPPNDERLLRNESEKKSTKKNSDFQDSLVMRSNEWEGYPNSQEWRGYPKDYWWESVNNNSHKRFEKSMQIPHDKSVSDTGCKENRREGYNTRESICDNNQKRESSNNTQGGNERLPPSDKEFDSSIQKIVQQQNKQTVKENRNEQDNTTSNLDDIEQLTASVETLDVASDFSENSQVPGLPTEVDSSSSSITIAWESQCHNSQNITNYEIKYREFNKAGSKWMSVLTDNTNRIWSVTDLRSGTEYEFKVRAVDEEGEEGPFSSPNVKMSTQSSIGSKIQCNAKLVKSGIPKIYKLPVHVSEDTTNYEAKCRKCVFGKRSSLNQEKTIMLVGATGSGKSTLIDAMINYICNVSWEDEYRFTLLDLTEDERNKINNQENSQTEWITCYTIHHLEGSNVDYDLNIIDTPGFGDTRGIIRDKELVDQIHSFFSSPSQQIISVIDAVCFVTQAPLARLTPPQRYIFDSILSIFGHDIKDNIYVLITFADGNEPPIKAALAAANVPFQKSFKFNNSALFADTKNEEEAKFGNLFWKMGQESLQIFFDEMKLVESKSLHLTAEVLSVRQHLQAAIQGLKPQIDEGMNQLNNIRQEVDVLDRHKTDIECNKNFTYEVNEIKMKKKDLKPGKYVTNCVVCNRTCHYPCRIWDDDKKMKCSAMDDGECTVCPEGCSWHEHVNSDFRIVTYSAKVKKTYEELKAKYENAQAQEKKQICVLQKVKLEFSSLYKRVQTMISNVRCFINKLNEIALRPNPLTDIDYIDLLIESEKSEKKYGWQERVKIFHRLREDAELLSKTKEVDFKPWDVNVNEFL